ncbi:MAG: hypothetical protein COV07_04250 [Candidatus Vogelbacteria bacterium CG10_big_fil_rev_8_21_14_0_10_45_14]|uniref:J domain-containing protein n=1 Tax=Candidatus Vogelbacteria bacterium CG10_big_fil_rev_8_21_14_0_10_45_14 TaxID=1975042 RepID=A0A2H0RIK3_9BACT|nr:MAG: hypothetical protein COV07_04250 [Candidatus Vogelbacteria bacterium CG10_big_fil_rev_8_21_14_0_10_45_14]
MPRRIDKRKTSLEESPIVQELRLSIRKRERELERGIAQADALKQELVCVEREYGERIAPLVYLAHNLDERIFSLKKVRDMVMKGKTVAEAKRIVKERERERDERERERMRSGGREDNAQRENEDNFFRGGEGKNAEKGDTSHSISKKTAPSTELKKLWRKLAYRFHPDLTQDDLDKTKREAVMKQVNDAYQRADIFAMREILTQDAKSEMLADSSCMSERDLREALLDIEESLRRITQKLIAFRKSPWFALSKDMQKAKREKYDYFAYLTMSQEGEVRAREKLIARIERELLRLAQSTRLTRKIA